MLHDDPFAFLDRTADAAFAITEHGEVCSSNAAAGALFARRDPATTGPRRRFPHLFRMLDAIRVSELTAAARVGGPHTATRAALRRTPPPRGGEVGNRCSS